MHILIEKILVLAILILTLNPIVVINANSNSLKAERIVASMSLEEKIGQMFLVKYQGFNPLSLAKEYHLGGFIWYGKNFIFKTPNMVKKEIDHLQANVSIPLFIAVDEEGGTVNRISSYPQFRSEPFLSQREYYQQSGWSLIEKTEKEKIELLKELGLNLNFGLVVDIPHSSNDYIYPRAFSTEANDVSQLTKKVIEIYKNSAVGIVLKHFPGYGNNIDTHKNIAYDYKSLEELMASDLLPFTIGVNFNASAIMVSHNIMINIDEQYPATLSEKVVSILRNEMNYEGLIVTDDLSMSGLTKLFPPEEAALLAIEAGNDILISSDFEIQILSILKSIEEGRITEARINESVLKIIETKLELKIIN